jgi:hypothetical protein
MFNILLDRDGTHETELDMPFGHLLDRVGDTSVSLLGSSTWR